MLDIHSMNVCHLFMKVNQRDPDSNIHGANTGPIWGRQDPGGPHVGPWTLLSGDVRSCFNAAGAET